MQNGTSIRAYDGPMTSLHLRSKYLTMESKGANIYVRKKDLKAIEDRGFVKNKTTTLNPVCLGRTFSFTPYRYLHVLNPVQAMGWQISTQDGRPINYEDLIRE